MIGASCEDRVETVCRGRRPRPVRRFPLTGRARRSYISQDSEMQRTLPALASRMQALSSATRLRILLVLRDGALSVCQIAAVLGVPASTISSHLADLRRAGIVGEKRRGRFVWYALHRNDEAVQWLRLVARQAVDDPDVAVDRERAGRIRRVPPETLVASIECDAGIVSADPRSSSRRRGAA